MTENQRLKVALDSKNILSKDVAAMLSVKPSTVSGWINTEHIPQRTLDALKEKIGLNPDYIRSGNEPMYVEIRTEQALQNTLPTLERVLSVMEKQAEALLKGSNADQNKSEALNKNADAFSKYADTIAKQQAFIEELLKKADANGFKKLNQDLEKIRESLNAVLKDRLGVRKKKTGEDPQE